MVANFNDRVELERFLRDANVEELNTEREHLQRMMSDITPAASEHIVQNLVARIAYELRFRVPQSI